MIDKYMHKKATNKPTCINWMLRDIVEKTNVKKERSVVKIDQKINDKTLFRPIPFTDIPFEYIQDPESHHWEYGSC